MNDRGLGICVIGRNESARLGRALEKIKDRGGHRVYVDSASTDDSVAIAKSFDGAIDVIQLECTPQRPCTAALGRNIGFERLRERMPDLEYVQFIDGDCVLHDDWLDVAVEAMRTQSDLGILAGLLFEEDRARNVYHLLADMEWERHVGEVDAVGGICMVRADVYDQVGGMDPGVPQGEEAEFAARVRAQGHRVVRLEDEMARHDIGMEHFSEWWTRAKREGKAAAQAVHRNGLEDRDSVKHLASMLAWGAAVPAATAALLVPTLGTSVALLGSYSILWRRVRNARAAAGDVPKDSAVYASATVVGKIANATGCARYASDVVRERIKSRLPWGK